GLVRPGHRQEAGLCGVVVGLVAAVAVAVARARLRLDGVRVAAGLEDLGRAGDRAQAVRALQRPARALALERLRERAVGGERVVVLERDGLVARLGEVGGLPAQHATGSSRDRARSENATSAATSASSSRSPPVGDRGPTSASPIAPTSAAAASSGSSTCAGRAAANASR